MAEFYTLEQAARVLGMSPGELKDKAQSREIRAFLDGGTWRFRMPDVDELARRRGMGSDPDLSLSDLDLIAQADSGSDFEVMTHPSAQPSGGEMDILLDDLSLPPLGSSSSSSTIIGMGLAGKSPGESDVRVVPDLGKGSNDSDVQIGFPGASQPKPPSRKPGSGSGSGSGSDVIRLPDSGAPHQRSGTRPGMSESDVRVVPAFAKGSSASDVRVVPDFAKGSSASDVRPVPDFAQGSNDPDAGRTPASGGSSRPKGSSVELITTGAGSFEEADSGSDFELTALEGSDEFDATPAPRRSPGDSDVTGQGLAASGVNLARPSDSGINLQAPGGFVLDRADSADLAPLDDVDLAPLSSSAMSPPPGLVDEDDSELSATALPVPSERALFDDTDFEVDALETGHDHQTVQLDAASDFDLDEDADSSSRVFAVDEEDVDLNAATALGPAALDDLDDSSGEVPASQSPASSDVAPGGWDVAGETEVRPVGRGAVAPVLASAEARHEWGGIWVGFLMVATVFVLMLSFVGMELLHNMYEYHGSTPIGSPLVKQLSGLIGS